VTKNVSLTGGVDNVFDKRHWRAGMRKPPVA
jgi:ferric enterobactin receptor